LFAADGVGRKGEAREVGFLAEQALALVAADEEDLKRRGDEDREIAVIVEGEQVRLDLGCEHGATGGVELHGGADDGGGSSGDDDGVFV
jgi:hypothetical protein